MSFPETAGRYADKDERYQQNELYGSIVRIVRGDDECNCDEHHGNKQHALPYVTRKRRGDQGAAVGGALEGAPGAWVRAAMRPPETAAAANAERRGTHLTHKVAIAVSATVPQGSQDFSLRVDLGREPSANFVKGKRALHADALA